MVVFLVLLGDQVLGLRQAPCWEREREGEINERWLRWWKERRIGERKKCSKPFCQDWLLKHFWPTIHRLFFSHRSEENHEGQTIKTIYSNYFRIFLEFAVLNVAHWTSGLLQPLQLKLEPSFKKLNQQFSFQHRESCSSHKVKLQEQQSRYWHHQVILWTFR